MMKTRIALLASLLLLTSSTALAAAEGSAAGASLESIAPYPAADKGMTRQVITLPPQTDEENFKVELVVGKTMTVDCNRVLISGQIERGTIDGWGFDYLVLGKIGEPATTMMACPDNKKHEAFVPINLGQEAIQRYNSKLPIVLYVPEGITVKYRFWRADADLQTATIN